MKLKYKKIILLTALSTMGIGLLTLSISQDRPQARENISAKNSKEASLLMDSGEEVELFALSDETSDAALLEPTSVPSPTATPTPTPIPVFELERNEKMDAFFKDYYTAKAKLDIEKITSMCSDSSKSITLEQLQQKVMFVEDYLNIKTYTKKGPEDGSYIAYVYADVKFSNIDTKAPGLSKFYVVTDSEGNYKIYTQEMSPEVEEFYEARENDQDVQELIKKTEEKSKEAKKSDEDLKIYWNGLDNLVKEDTSGSEKKSE